jgi:hypothetical protein
MAVCETCGNDYDTAFELVAAEGVTLIRDRVDAPDRAG